MLNNIAALLDKFRKISNRGLVIRTLTKEILEKDFLIKIPLELIKTKGSTVSINVSGSAKAEIATQKEKIIKKINERLGKEEVSDIR